METILFFFQHLNRLEDLIIWGGYAVLAIIVFAESGLLFGFFLPGDSLLVTAGLLASQGYLDIWPLVGLLWMMAVLGDSVGYELGRVTGPRIFKKEKSIFFAKHHLIRSQSFYEKHGGKTIIIARFMPIIRTFAPIVAGVGKMPYLRFLSFNVFGGLFWVGVTLGLGYGLGRTIPGIEKYLHFVIAAVILASVAPAGITWLRQWKRGKE